jgi:hypothetical protein
VVAVEGDGLIDIANVLIEAFWDIEMGFVPSAFGQGFESAGDGGATPTDGDEGDAALVEAGKVVVVGELGIEAEPLGVAPGDAVPEIDEAEDFAGLVGAGEIGVGVA